MLSFRSELKRDREGEESTCQLGARNEEAVPCQAAPHPRGGGGTTTMSGAVGQMEDLGRQVAAALVDGHHEHAVALIEQMSDALAAALTSDDRPACDRLRGGLEVASHAAADSPLPRDPTSHVRGLLDALIGIAILATPRLSEDAAARVAGRPLARDVRRELSRSSGMLSEAVLARALRVRPGVLVPALGDLRTAGLIQMTPSLGCDLVLLTREGERRLRAMAEARQRPPAADAAVSFYDGETPAPH